MLNDIEQLLIEGNYQFQNKINQNPENFSLDKKIPAYPILFLTCIDPRVDIHQIFQFNPGDVFILRNAGNIYTLDMMRSIFIAIYLYNIKYIIILGHIDCEMTKINLKELRLKLPNEFLKRLSTNYSDLLSKLDDFFKPIDHEIRNILEQMNNLQEIKVYFPDVEITGMLYDIKTGWIFTKEDFRDLLINQNHSKIYKGLLYEKNQQLSKFLEEINKKNQESKELVNEIQVNDLELQEKPNALKIEEENIVTLKNDEDEKSIDKKNVGFQIKMPKVQVPKIYIPKLKIYIPKSAKVKEH